MNKTSTPTQNKLDDLLQADESFDAMMKELMPFMRKRPILKSVKTDNWRPGSEYDKGESNAKNSTTSLQNFYTPQPYSA